jgi:hypothetical protein
MTQKHPKRSILGPILTMDNRGHNGVMDTNARGASDNGEETILGGVGLPDGGDDQQLNGSSLDHALLESIFYNEMALLDDFSEAFFASNSSYNSSYNSSTNSVSSSLGGGGGSATLTTNAATSSLQGTLTDANQLNSLEAAAPAAAAAIDTIATTAPDPTVAVEKDLLRDFGVAHSSPALLSPVGSTTLLNPNAATIAPPALPFVPPPVNVEEQRRNLQALAGRGRGIRHNVVAKAAAATTTATSPATTSDLADTAAVAVATATDAATTTGASIAPMDTADKRSKLVAQFATLAGRLGITLPPQVLHKLTAAVPNTATDTTTSNSIGALEANVDILVDATESSHKRPHEDMSESSSPRQSQSQVPAAAAAAAAKPYSKRRKKPRLSDCEQKLALLQAEQALLQSQVAQMANRNETLDQERLAAESKMRTMLHDPQSTPEQLDQAVQEFSDLYSDYGRKRHEELLFHLEQLQRYVRLHMYARAYIDALW